MYFKIRVVKPDVSNWSEIEADTIEDAIQTVHNAGVPHGFKSPKHDHYFSSLKYTHYLSDGGRNDIYFAAFEVDGQEGEYISRIYYTGIWRKGGVVGKRTTIQEIANQLGWTKSANELLGEGWSGEESWDSARERKWGSR